MSYQDDLDWLARYMHEWPFGTQSYVYVITEDDGSKIWGGNVHYCAKRHQKVGKEDWLARRAELQHNPNWHEHGELPPIGVFVDVTGDVAYGEGEKGCEVIAHVEDCAVIRMSCGLGCFEAKVLSPTSTWRDEAIEAMKALCPYPGSWDTTYRLFAESLYDAGYRAGGSE